MVIIILIFIKNKILKHHNIHRLVAMTFLPNIENKKYVDHIDNNRLNNTISNLRWCDLSENQHNRKLNKNSTSAIKGVYWHKEKNKWQAQIMINNKQIYLGCFTNLHNAKLARQLKAKELYGIYTNECEKIII